MQGLSYNQLQIREIFHLEFLRHFSRKIKPNNYAIKGGVNLRFFFDSFRYSEDMDIDAFGISVHALKEIVMGIFASVSFLDSLKPFGIERVVAPNVSKAKQTPTTQRFKIHLITASGEDLFTKIEFSRRVPKGEAVVEGISDKISRFYKILPLFCPHYTIASAIEQKIQALALRAVVQARDVFDLYILQTQSKVVIKSKSLPISKAKENIFPISFAQFRDTVLSYLAPQDRSVYEKADLWDEIKLKVIDYLDSLK